MTCMTCQELPNLFALTCITDYVYVHDIKQHYSITYSCRTKNLYSHMDFMCTNYLIQSFLFEWHIVCDSNTYCAYLKEWISNNFIICFWKRRGFGIQMRPWPHPEEQSIKLNQMLNIRWPSNCILTIIHYTRTLNWEILGKNFSSSPKTMKIKCTKYFRILVCCGASFHMSILLQWLLPLRHYKHGTCSFECRNILYVAAPPCSPFRHTLNTCTCNWTSVEVHTCVSTQEH